MRKLLLAIGTGLGAGYIPYCPGTVGTLWGVLIYIVLSAITFNLWWHIAVTLGVILLGMWISGRCERILKDRDHSSIVIDEIGGYLVAMIGISFSVPFLVLGFLLFRLLDIAKPFRIEKLQNYSGGWAVVLDDVAAGVLANILLRIMISMLGW